jgi:predicted nucleic acid-binding protein
VARFTALFDASVLYSASISFLVMETARAGIFRARWSPQIHDEWTRNLIKNRPDLDPIKVHRRREIMDVTVHDALITEFDDLIPSIDLPDPDDKHVLAAAIAGHADVIVTLNLRDFPADNLVRYGIEAQHPDTFLIHQRGLNEQLFLQCVRRCRRRLKNPEIDVDRYLEGLRKAGLVVLAAELGQAKGLL